MHRTIIAPLLAALSLLSACAKVETAESSPEGRVISFSPILGGVRTKTDTVMPQADTEESGKVGATAMTKADAAAPKDVFQFYSHAWYLSDGKKWDTDKTDAELYIDKATIIKSDVKKNDRYPWKSKDVTYYWPRGGSLTFLSYTCVDNDQKPNISLFTSTDHGTVNIDKEKGLTITDFINYKTGDLLVADFAKDRRADLNGVPTVFRHKLARISFHVSQEEQTTGQTTQDTYKLTGLKLTNIYDKGDYSGGGYENDSWSNRKEASTYGIFQTGDDQAPIEVSLDRQQIGSFVMVIPQNLLATAEGKEDSKRQAPQIIISYTKNDTVQDDKTLDLSDLGTNFWAMGKDYKYNITFGSGDHPINFSGSVGEWGDSDKSDVNIGMQ